jgi:hypothetical protein
VQDNSFKEGEWFKFRIHYGIFNASYASLRVHEKTLNGKEVFHVVGKGKSTGLLDLFFKVDDNYETYFDKADGRPYRFIRKIDEGGHTKNIEILFDHDKKEALVKDKKRKRESVHKFEGTVQDMLSSYYYLRNEIDPSTLKKGQEIKMKMFFDKENYNFKLKFLGREVLSTKFGDVPCLKFRPIVQSGRVFKEEESLTVWVSDDQNKMPIRIKADIIVGSIKADLDAYKGLKYPFKIRVKN